MTKTTETLNSQQIACARAYLGGEHDAILRSPRWRRELDHIGDSLLTFLMLELSTGEDCNSNEEATRRLGAVMLDLSAVIDAVSP